MVQHRCQCCLCAGQLGEDQADELDVDAPSRSALLCDEQNALATARQGKTQRRCCISAGHDDILCPEEELARSIDATDGHIGGLLIVWMPWGSSKLAPAS
jgi:hypothetical protein